MSGRKLLFILAALGAAACSDSSPPTAASVVAPAPRAGGARDARERLSQALARALADPGTRAAVKRRLDASSAPEGKLQFQALVRTDQGTLLASLARAGATSPADLLAELDAAQDLELYLPVPAQRAAWNGDARYLVGTIGSDGEIPVGFDSSGGRHLLDPNTPPEVPVLALVPQETDFTRTGASRIMGCTAPCGDDAPPGNGGGPTNDRGRAPGLYLVQSHFDGSYESWLKGQPEYEYHVYGLNADSESVELACTGERAGGAYAWDQNALDWTGSVMLLSDADYNEYQRQHPGAPVRIVAWEDDDEACVDHADRNGVAALIAAVDNAYKTVTSGKPDPTLLRGIKAAPSIFSLVGALRNIIVTNDDLIGNAVEGTVTGEAPNGANWVLKGTGTITTGWFTTLRVQQ